MTDPTNPQPPPPAPAPAPAPANTTPEVPVDGVPDEALADRLRRQARANREAVLKELGFSSVEEAQAFKAKADADAAAEEERKRAEMSELERVRAEKAVTEQALATERSRAEAAERASEEAAILAHLQGLCAARGIKNPDYALFKLEKAVNGLEDGAELDEVAFLDDLIKDPRERYSLGVDADAPAPAARPATTTPPSTQPAPTPGGVVPEFDASTATPEEMSKRLDALGFH